MGEAGETGEMGEAGELGELGEIGEMDEMGEAGELGGEDLTDGIGAIDEYRETAVKEESEGTEEVCEQSVSTVESGDSGMIWYINSQIKLKMKKGDTFEDLYVWKNAVALAKEIFQL